MHRSRDSRQVPPRCASMRATPWGSALRAPVNGELAAAIGACLWDWCRRIEPLFPQAANSAVCADRCSNGTLSLSGTVGGVVSLHERLVAGGRIGNDTHGRGPRGMGGAEAASCAGSPHPETDPCRSPHQGTAVLMVRVHCWAAQGWACWVRSRFGSRCPCWPPMLSSLR